jgi:hypothetical protein
MEEETRRKQGAAMKAGIILAALRFMKELGLTDPTPPQVVAALSISKTQGYEMARLVRGYAEQAPGPGRPRQEPVPAPDGWEQWGRVCAQIRTFLMEHPGAAHRVETRMRYAPIFRDFVLRLFEPGGSAHGMTIDQGAAAIGISRYTLASWLAGGQDVCAAAEREAEQAPPPEAEVPPSPPREAAPPQPDPTSDADDVSVVVTSAPFEAVAAPVAAAPSPDSESPPPPPATSSLPEMAQRVVDLKKKWRGSFKAFCRSLPEHGLALSERTVARILARAKMRKIHKRRRRYPDVELRRKKFRRFFPNAQQSEDGGRVSLQFGDEQPFGYSIQLFSDVVSRAYLGLAVRRFEDATGFLEAKEQALVTTGGEPPLAILHDDRSCNQAQTIKDSLAQDGTINMSSIHRRPQSNTLGESQINLFKTALPPLVFPLPGNSRDSLAELGQRIVDRIAHVICADQNNSPRKVLADRTPVETFAAHVRTPEEDELTSRELNAIKRDVDALNDPDRKRCRPATLQFVREEMQRLGLDDPEGKYALAVARHGLYAAIAALAIFQANEAATGERKQAAPDYLVGIARRVRERGEDLAAYDHMVRIGERAGELILQPLSDELARLQAAFPPDKLLDELLTRALFSEAPVDRSFWRCEMISRFRNSPADSRRETGRRYARRIARQHSIPRSERQALLELVARIAAGLAS